MHFGPPQGPTGASFGGPRRSNNLNIQVCYATQLNLSYFFFSNFINSCTYFLAIGSLSIQKRFDKLISSFNLIKEHNFKLYIVGQGPLKEDLNAQIKQQGLSDKISLVGYSDNVYNWLKKTDYFVISSDYEGLGTVIIESIYNQTKS